MPKIVEAYGWSMGMDRWIDETGMFHLMVRRAGADRAGPACGAKVFCGGVERDTSRGQKCRACQRAADKRERERTRKPYS